MDLLRVTPFPKEIRLENTNACNARCVICPREKQTRKIGVIAPELVEQIVDEAKGQAISKFTVQGFGEPLLDENFCRHLRYIKRQLNCSTFSVSNASRITPELADEVVRCGLDKIKISFYGINAQEYESVHPATELSGNRAGGEESDRSQATGSVEDRHSPAIHRPYVAVRAVHVSMDGQSRGRIQYASQLRRRPIVPKTASAIRSLPDPVGAHYSGALGWKGGRLLLRFRRPYDPRRSSSSDDGRSLAWGTLSTAAPRPCDGRLLQVAHVRVLRSAAAAMDQAQSQPHRRFRGFEPGSGDAVRRQQKHGAHARNAPLAPRRLIAGFPDVRKRIVASGYSSDGSTISSKSERRSDLIASMNFSTLTGFVMNPST